LLPATEIHRPPLFGHMVWKKKNLKRLSFLYPSKLKILPLPFSYLSNYIIAFGQQHKNYRVGHNNN
jgi:hypothetical protein